MSLLRADDVPAKVHQGQSANSHHIMSRLFKSTHWVEKMVIKWDITPILLSSNFASKNAYITLVFTLNGEYPISKKSHSQGLPEREIFFACLRSWQWYHPPSHEIFIKSQEIILNISEYYTNLRMYSCIGDLRRLANTSDGGYTPDSIHAVSCGALPVKVKKVAPYNSDLCVILSVGKREQLQMWRFQARQHDRINMLPVELLQEILVLTIEGTFDDQLRTVKNITVTNRNFHLQMRTDGLLKKVRDHFLSVARDHPHGKYDYNWRVQLDFQPRSVRDRIAALRSRHPRNRWEATSNYVSRLMQSKVVLDDALFLAVGSAASREADDIKGQLQFQSAEVQDRIKRLREQYPRLPREQDDHYILRLGQMSQPVADALFLALGFVHSREARSFENRLEFQSAELQDRIATLRSQYPRKDDEVEDEHQAFTSEETMQYVRRLGRANMTLKDAFLIAFGRTDPWDAEALEALLEFEPAEVRHRIADLRSRYPMDKGEDKTAYVRRLGLENITLEDALLLVDGQAHSSRVKRYQDLLEFQPAEVQDRIAKLRSRFPRNEREDETAYVRRLGLVKVALEDALLIALGRANPRNVGDFEGLLEFQLAEVQHRIATLRSQCPRNKGETNDDYIVRLGRENVAIDDAILLALGRVNTNNTRRFEDFIVPDWIGPLRSQYPRLPGEMDVDYLLRLGRNDVEVDDAVLIALGYMEMGKVEACSYLLEFQSAEVRRRIATLRSQHPRDEGETNDEFIRRMRLVNIALEDAVLLATGFVDPGSVKWWSKRIRIPSSEPAG